MSQGKNKIGFSEIGGIFIGKGIQSTFHRHYSVSIIVSFGGHFSIAGPDQKKAEYQAVLIQKMVSYTLESNENDSLAFLHIVPHAEAGMNLSSKRPIQKLPIDQFADFINQLEIWLESDKNDSNSVEKLIEEASGRISIPGIPRKTIDHRIKKALVLIENSDDEKVGLDKIAFSVDLSPSHFARLLKRETGLTFREFVLHSKLTKSIFAMYKANSLTAASFIGGFADQPHFTRTFKGAFGIQPSKSLK